MHVFRKTSSEHSSITLVSLGSFDSVFYFVVPFDGARFRKHGVWQQQKNFAAVIYTKLEKHIFYSLNYFEGGTLDIWRRAKRDLSRFERRKLRRNPTPRAGDSAAEKSAPDTAYNVNDLLIIRENRKPGFTDFYRSAVSRLMFVVISSIIPIGQVYRISFATLPLAKMWKTQNCPKLCIQGADPKTFRPLSCMMSKHSKKKKKNYPRSNRFVNSRDISFTSKFWKIALKCLNFE